jgi:hypothetical protein
VWWLTKNTANQVMRLALSNMRMARRRLLDMDMAQG